MLTLNLDSFTPVELAILYIFLTQSGMIEGAGCVYRFGCQSFGELIFPETIKGVLAESRLAK